MIVVSVGAGIQLAASADRSILVWAAARDVTAGTVLRSDDVRPARVRLFDSAPRYLDVAASPVGRIVTRRLAEGELVPLAAVRMVPPAAVVNIPVQPANAPAVARGQSVDVWATSKDCPPERVLAAAPVQDVRTEDGALSAGSGTLQVVVRVGAVETERVLAALSREATIRLVVLEGDLPHPGPATTACVGRDRAADR